MVEEAGTVGLNDGIYNQKHLNSKEIAAQTHRH
jgi:hypothetical protein